ncbi:MAG: HAD hydrolase-like protein [Nanoarchaeota archaeon]|nr:HAD hydrolase-like protein [Nanoarchaeota archaeon]
MKKIIFFDADGTLWYPRETKYEQHPVWIYRTYINEHEARKRFVIVPTVLKTLKKLKGLKIKLILLSTHPKSPKEANPMLKRSLEYHKLTNLFDEVHATKDHYESKGEFILSILKKYKLKKKEALMVGDSYEWDYKPARDVGVEALLIKTNYKKNHPSTKKVRRTIRRLKDIFEFLK